MGQYLDKFSSAISKKQAEQVLKLLNKKRNSGQIRNIKEFSQQLSSLMSELTATTLQPTTKLFLAQADQKTSSEQYNFMLDRVHDDLEAAFVEANNIDTIQASHESVVKDVILKNLRSAIAELEAKTNLYELLNSNPDNFDTALFSTFKESRNSRLYYVASQDRILFKDPRKLSSEAPMNDATTELIGERLVLGESSTSYHAIAGIKQIFDSTTPPSEFVVKPSHTSIDNIIDNTKGTFWVQNILFSEKQQYARVKLELDLGITREFNFIEVEPATNKDMILESVEFIDNNNAAVDLIDNELTVDSPISLRIKKTAAQKVILTFRVDHYKPTQFEYTQYEPLLDQALGSQSIEPNIQLVGEDLKKFIASKDVQEVIGITDNTVYQYKGYEFIVGLDNVRIGLVQYLSNSVYVSKPLNVASVGQIGLKATEVRPYSDSDIIKYTNDTYTNTNFMQGSIEYWVVKQDYSADGSLLNTIKFPILPFNVSSVKHERLILTDKSDVSLPESDIGYTMFLTNTNASEGDIHVYRNGVLLTDETGNNVATDGWQNVSVNGIDNKPNSGVPMRFKIKIVAPLPGDIFTVSYNILTSSTRSIPSSLGNFTTVGGLQIVDLVGNLSAYADDTQLVTIGNQDVVNTTKEVKVYLAIVLRQNTADTSISAAVEDYTLMVSKYDINKYEDS